jgi:hypothetical protein
MGDLLKEALAEAKLVKKVSIEAAREQLNEALTPRIESMLSKKLQAEIADEEEVDDIKESDDFDEDDELQETEDPGSVTDKIDKKDQNVTPDLQETEDPGSVTDKIDKKDQNVTPDLTEGDEFDANAIEDETEEDDLEIESILRELEDGSEEDKELGEQELELPVDEPVVDELPIDEPVEEEELLDEPVEDEIPEIPEGKNKFKDKFGKKGMKEEDEIPIDIEDDEEEINVEALLSQIDEEEYPGEGESEDKDKEQQNVVKQLESKNAALRKRLSEYVKVVKVLKSELNEVNLLNTKLYYTTKMFKKFNVSSPTKIKIIETFDRANSIREIKLIYATLHESLRTTGISNKPKIKSVKDIKENVRSSSKTIITDRYEIKEAILSEGEDLKNRWKKLSGQVKE